MHSVAARRVSSCPAEVLPAGVAVPPVHCSPVEKVRGLPEAAACLRPRAAWRLSGSAGLQHSQSASDHGHRRARTATHRPPLHPSSVTHTLAPCAFACSVNPFPLCLTHSTHTYTYTHMHMYTHIPTRAQFASLDPATHAYSFWEGVPASGKRAFGELFAKSKSLRVSDTARHKL